MQGAVVVLLGQQTVLLAPIVFFQQLPLRVVVTAVQELAVTVVLAAVAVQIKVQQEAQELLDKAIMVARQYQVRFLTLAGAAVAKAQLAAQQVPLVLVLTVVMA